MNHQKRQAMRFTLGIGAVIAVTMLVYGLVNSEQVEESAPPVDAQVPREPAEYPVATMSVESVSDSFAPVNFDANQCVEGEPVRDTALIGTTIIVDPGHGGEDLGTINNSVELTESELVLSISMKLTARLRDSGARVCVTRINDSYIGLGARAEFANERDGDAYVSIHLNSLPDPSQNYVMTMWGAEAKDRFIAESVLATLALEMAGPEFHEGEPNPMDANLYVLEDLASNMLRGAQMPAVLVEASFLSNDWEARAFRNGINDGTHWREHQVARAVHDGLMNYFEAFE